MVKSSAAKVEYGRASNLSDVNSLAVDDLHNGCPVGPAGVLCHGSPAQTYCPAILGFFNPPSDPLFRIPFRLLHQPPEPL
jgi:hypothetical protein